MSNICFDYSLLKTYFKRNFLPSERLHATKTVDLRFLTGTQVFRSPNDTSGNSGNTAFKSAAKTYVGQDGEPETDESDFYQAKFALETLNI